jgi:hypothetical protein
MFVYRGISGEEGIYRHLINITGMQDREVVGSGGHYQ